MCNKKVNAEGTEALRFNAEYYLLAAKIFYHETQ